MKQTNLLAIFDSHTPYLAFRLNALCDALKRRGLADRIRLHIILIGAEEKRYGWEGSNLQAFYDAEVQVLWPSFRGLGMKTFLHPSVIPCMWKCLKQLIRLRPKVSFVGGYDRPEGMMTALLSPLWGGKTGAWSDSKFSDSESYSKRIGFEWLKSLMVRRFHFFMCPGLDSADYHRFLSGGKRPALTEAWDVVDNDSIRRASLDESLDEKIREALGLSDDRPYFFLPTRFVEKKNINRVLDAYISYRKEAAATALPLVICGMGPDGDAIRAKAIECHLQDNVQIVPWLAYDQIPRACHLSRAVLLASTHDQWGMIVNEALAAGAPVLVSNRCGSHVLVKNHQNGFTFDPFDTRHISYLFEVMTREHTLVQHMRDQAYPSLKDFSIQTWIDRHFSILEHYGVLDSSESKESLQQTSAYS